MCEHPVGVEHGSRHGHNEVNLAHGWNIERHHRHDRRHKSQKFILPSLSPKGHDRRRQAEATPVSLRPCIRCAVVDDISKV
nr:hypothetical protein Itr_chr05CG17460 [Ipomoea trifida]